MTKQTPHPAQEAASSLDERIEILARELELAVKWQRPCILLVVYSSEFVRSDVEAALENCLMDLGQNAVRLQLKRQPTESVLSFLREFKDPTNSVFLVHGLHWGQTDETSVYSTLNLQREFFVERQIRAIFWLTQNEIVNLAHYAPDFWAYRHRVIEFVESPKAERVLQEALESAWQGTGEYAETYDDTDARISMRESLLTDLPDGEEACALRANLFLTLGVLNWRKGDFEKASEQLGEALKIASRMEDSWFEAECYNALALVKTSTESTDEAIAAYKEAIRLAPDQIFAWNNLGNLCARIGRNDEAMIAFRKAIECNPKDPIAWNGLANLHFGVGYMDDAIASYRKSIQYMPTFAQPWNGLGDVYATMGRSDEAMKAYHKAIELNKQYVTPWIRLGVMFTKQERYREAARAYQRAVALDPRNSHTWNDLGTVYLKCEALEDATDAFLKAIELDRGYGWAYSNLAYTYTLLGKYKETVSLLLRSIELLQSDQDKAVSWNRLANVYRLLNDYENAISAYQMADQLDVTRRGAQRGETEIRQEMDAVQEEAPVAVPAAEPPQPVPVVVAEPVSDLEETRPRAVVHKSVQAEPAAKEAAAPQGTDAPAWLFPDQHVDAAADAGLPEATTATATLEAATANVQPEPAALAATTDEGKDDMDALNWIEQGNACFTRGAYDDAIAAYNRAIQLDPKFGVPYGNLALTYVTQGHFTEAVLLYQKSIELLGSNAEKAVCWSGLGNAYRCLHDYQNAMTAYQKAAELDPDTSGIRERAQDFQAAQPRGDAEARNETPVSTRTEPIQQAVAVPQPVAAAEPQDGRSYANQAQAMVSQNKYQEAVPLYQKSIELLQDNKEKAAAWNRLGNVYRKLNDYENAIKAYQKAVVLADEGVDLLTRTRFSLLSNCYVNS